MSKASILIVEDEAIVAEDLAGKLRRLGYEISGTAARGEDAVALARNLRPNLVLMDIRLKGAMDGVEAAAIIRRECGLPVIYLTAHSDRATLERAKITEPFGYLLKPFHELMLETHVQMALYKHEAERKLRESELRLRLLAENTDDMIALHSHDGQVLYASPSNSRLAVAKDWRTQVHPDDLLRVEQAHQANLSGENTTVEYRFRSKDGSWVWLETKCQVIFGPDGKPHQRVVASRDITERKRAEDTLRFLAQCGTGSSSEGFFPELARYLAQTLGMDFVCIDRLEQGNLAARTLAMFDKGRFLDNVTYTLKDTPCGDVVGQRICRFPRNVRQLFPKDTVLQEMQAESYLGTTLWSAQGKPIGLIAVIGRQPLADTRPGEAILQLVAVRAAGEMERLQAEEALRESEARLKRSEEIAHLGGWELDLASGELKWSDEVYRIFGLQPQEFAATYEAFLERVHPEDRAAVDAAYSGSVREGRDSYEIEHRVVRKSSGEIRWVHEKCQHLRNAGGKVIRSLGMVHDITARKQAGEALRQSAQELQAANASLQESRRAAMNLMEDAVAAHEQSERMGAALQEERDRLAALINSIRDEIWFADAEGRFTLVNPVGSREFNLEAGEPTDARQLAASLEVFQPDGTPRPVEDSPALRALRGDVVTNEEEVIRTPATGELRYRQVGAAPVHGRSGQIIGSVSVVRDVTERKRAEEALRQTEERMRLAAEAAELGMWEADPVTGTLTWSARARTIFGVAGDAPIDHQVFLKCLHPDDRDRVLEARQRALDPAGDGRYEIEYRILWADGTVRWTVATGRAFFGTVKGERRATRFVGILRDVTARKLAETALRRSNERFRLLSTVTARLLTSENPQTIVNELCTAVMEHLDCQAFFNFMADAPSGRLHLNTSAGISGEEARKIEWLDYGVAVCGCAAQAGSRIVAEDIQHTPDPRTELVKGYGIQAYACHPLMAEGRLLGTLSFGTTRRARFADDELALMKTVADQVAVAMDRMQTAHALHRLNRTLNALSKSDRAMMRAETEGAYLAEVCKNIVENCGHTMVWIGYAEEDDARSVRPVASAGFEEGYLETLRVTWADNERGRGPTGTAIRTGKPCVCGDILNDPRLAPWREEAVKRGYASSLALPLAAEGRTFGSLTIYSPQPAAFLEDEVVLLGQLADDLAHGIHVLRLRKAREEFEERIRRSERQYRAMFELAAVGMVEIDLHTGRLLRMNGRFCQITGYNGAEILGRPLAEIIYLDDRQALSDLLQRFVGGGTRDYRNEQRVVCKDGRNVWVLVSVNVIHDQAGKPWHAMVAIDDISERKKFEQALRRAKEEWEKTFDSVPDLVAILDDQHRIIRANRAMARRLGVTPHQCIGQVCHRFVHGTEKPHASCPHSLTLADNGEHVAEVTESRLGGDFLVSTTPILDDNNKVIGVVHVARDITARKQMEARLREMNAVLEHRVAERTADLEKANQQLLREAEKRNRANRALRVLSQTNEAIIRATDEAAFLKQVCRILVSSGGYRLAWIGFAEHDRAKTIRPVADAGFEKGRLQSLQLSWADTLKGRRPSGVALRTGKTVVCRDAVTDRRFRHWRNEASSLGVGSAIALPLKLDHRQMGVLAIAVSEVEAFDAGEVKLLTELAGELVYAIGSLRTRQERHQLQEEVMTITEAERRRFGQELHDGLSPQLVAVRFASEMLHKKLSQDSSPHAPQAAEMTGMLGATVEQARNVSLMLNPVALEAEGLMAAIERLAADAGRIFKRPVRFLCPQSVFIGDNTVATHLYRITQEAVRNGITHGKATRVTISLLVGDGFIKLAVMNNGLPFPAVLPKGTGMGLKNMHYRAEVIGAHLEIRPRPQGGTLVTCTLPVRGPANRKKKS